MRASGGSSVMAERRLPGGPAELDYFPTPPWAARAGGELIARLDPAPGVCWEPACGEGHMAVGLADTVASVRSSDIHDYGFGYVHDFLSPAGGGGADPDWIVTNPPFVLGEAFVRAAWPRARRGVAMLLRLVFLEGAARHRLLYRDCPLTAVAPFSERVPMVKGRWDPAASSATAYAWFVWDKTAPPGPTVVMPIAPGAKTRLTRPGDALRFGCAAETPLFGDAV